MVLSAAVDPSQDPDYYYGIDVRLTRNVLSTQTNLRDIAEAKCKPAFNSNTGKQIVQCAYFLNNGTLLTQLQMLQVVALEDDLNSPFQINFSRQP